jgi:hypothetical protein
VYSAEVEETEFLHQFQEHHHQLLMRVVVEVALEINHQVLLHLQLLQEEQAEEETEDFKEMQQVMVAQI